MSRNELIIVKFSGSVANVGSDVIEY